MQGFSFSLDLGLHVCYVAGHISGALGHVAVLPVATNLEPDRLLNTFHHRHNRLGRRMREKDESAAKACSSGWGCCRNPK